MNLPDTLLLAALAAAASYGGSWAALRVHLHYVRRDVDRAQAAADRAHERIDEITAPVR